MGASSRNSVDDLDQLCRWNTPSDIFNGGVSNSDQPITYGRAGLGQFGSDVAISVPRQFDIFRRERLRQCSGDCHGHNWRIFLDFISLGDDNHRATFWVLPVGVEDRCPNDCSLLKFGIRHA